MTGKGLESSNGIYTNFTIERETSLCLVHVFNSGIFNFIVITIHDNSIITIIIIIIKQSCLHAIHVMSKSSKCMIDIISV